MGRIVLDRRDVAVEPHLQDVLTLGAHGGGDENPIAPDDGARVAEARDRSLPANVLTARHVPGDRRIGTLEPSHRLRPPELRPVVLLFGRRSRCQRSEHQARQHHATDHLPHRVLLREGNKLLARRWLRKPSATDR